MISRFDVQSIDTQLFKINKAETVTLKNNVKFTLVTLP